MDSRGNCFVFYCKFDLPNTTFKPGLRDWYLVFRRFYFINIIIFTKQFRINRSWIKSALGKYHAFIDSGNRIHFWTGTHHNFRIDLGQHFIFCSSKANNPKGLVLNTHNNKKAFREIRQTLKFNPFVVLFKTLLEIKYNHWKYKLWKNLEDQ